MRNDSGVWDEQCLRLHLHVIFLGASAVWEGSKAQEAQ